MYKTFDEAIKDLKERKIEHNKFTLHHITHIDKRIDFYTMEEVKKERLKKVYSAIGFKLLELTKLKNNFLCFPTVLDEIDNEDYLKTLFVIKVIILK